MSTTITRECPEGCQEFTYSGDLAASTPDEEEAFIRESAIPQDAPKECLVCGAPLEESVDHDGDAEHELGVGTTTPGPSDLDPMEARDLMSTERGDGDE